MELYDFVKLIRNKKKTIFTIVFTVLVLVLILNFVLPKKYGSEVQVLIIQNNLNNTDPYLVSKSSEHLGNILTRVVYSGSFYKKVMNSGFGISEAYFGDTLKDQLNAWEESIDAKNIEDTGILNISATHEDRDQAELIVESIAYNLKTSHTEYHGSGENVEIKIINEPVTSNFPVSPNMPINVVAGLVFSLMFSFMYIYMFPDRKYDLSLLPARRAKKEKKVVKRIESTIVEEKVDEKEKTPFKNDRRKNTEEMGGYFNEDEIYQDEEDGSESNGGYGEDSDDLEIDYEDIQRKGNIDNIL